MKKSIWILCIYSVCAIFATNSAVENKRIERELKEFDAIMADVKCAIAACGDFREIQVLTKRYLDEKTWDEINSEMHYSSRHTFELQKEAFRKIELYIAKKSVEKGYNNGAGQED